MTKRRNFWSALAAAASIGTAAHAAPAPPAVTTGADIKQLQFDWSIVPRSNYYEVWQKANNGSPYVKFFELKPWEPHATNNISAHLLDWDQARYQVKACNPSGCSASSEIAVKDRMLESIGYFKSEHTAASAHFGMTSAISADGLTLATFEANAGGVEHAPASVYIFAKIDGQWRQQEHFEPFVAVSGHYNFGVQYYAPPAAVALSANGNTLALTMPMLTCGNCAGRQTLWVYQRSAGAWKRTFVLLDPVWGATSSGALAINQAGDHIAFRRHYGEPYMILARSGSTWVQESEVPTSPADQQCRDEDLSGDLTTLSRVCYRPGDNSLRLTIARAPDWQTVADVAVALPEHYLFSHSVINYTGTAIAFATTAADENAPPEGLVFTIRNLGGQWQQQGPLRSGNWNGTDRYNFGAYLAWSRDAGYLAVAQTNDTGKGIGVLSPPLQPGGTARGAIYLYEMPATGARLRRVIKPNAAAANTWRYYLGLNFANNGKTLLISDLDDSSNGTGVDGNRNDDSAYGAGALWLY